MLPAAALPAGDRLSELVACDQERCSPPLITPFVHQTDDIHALRIGIGHREIGPRNRANTFW